jgi:hypothetical protein
MVAAGFGGLVCSGVNRGSRCGGGRDVDGANSSVAVEASAGAGTAGVSLELHHAEEKGMALGHLRKEEEGGGGVRLGGVWRKRRGGGSGQCMVRQEEWGSGRRQTRGRGGGGILSARQGTAARGPTGRSGDGAWAAAAMGSAHKNINLFDLFKGNPKRSDLIRLKDELSELKIFQIKYGQ